MTPHQQQAVQQTIQDCGDAVEVSNGGRGRGHERHPRDRLRPVPGVAGHDHDVACTGGPRIPTRPPPRWVVEFGELGRISGDQVVLGGGGVGVEGGPVAARR